ncbi:MAG TPA: type 1 glutamine amidotransferase domain-containing protein [Smithella sp.]|nr:type 1 glutamine amidotransferase domain-containing protein [Smithella sp.]
MILMPIPDFEFDPSETGIPWKVLKDNGVDITFATPSGKPGQADPRMLTGNGLGIWKKVLMANADALKCYASMTKDDKFNHPVKWEEINPADYAAIMLPGGHAPGMRTYLDSGKLQNIVVRFFDDQKPVGAICHGALLAARSIDPKTGKSVIYNYKTTALLKSQEMAAYIMTCLWRGRYYRTYPLTVEDEVKSFLIDKKNFFRGNSGLIRDTLNDTSHSFSVLDRKYLSARWPGDAYHFALEFLKLIK